MKILKIIAVILVFISFCFFIRVTDIQQVLLSLRQIGYHFIYLLLITFAAYWSATIGWKYCFAQEKNLSAAYLFFIRHIGEMVSLINPAGVVGGESLKIYLLQNKGIQKTNAIASVLVSRVMMAVTQLLLFFMTLTYVIFIDNGFLHRFPAISPVALTGVSLLVLLIITLSYTSIIKKTIEKLKNNPKVGKLVVKLQLRQVFTEFSRFFKTNKKGLLLCTSFFLLHWVIGSLEIYFILKFLGIKTGVVQVLFVDMGIILFKSAGVFVPGQIGVEEFGNKVMLDLIGVPDVHVWMTVSVLRRCRQLFWIVCGGAFYLFYNKQLSRFS